jgi:hypothetical protein
MKDEEAELIVVYYESIKRELEEVEFFFIFSSIKKGRRPKGIKNVTLKL